MTRRSRRRVERLSSCAPRVRSEGQRLLLGAPGTLAELAAACGVSKQALSDWRLGVKVPSVDKRRRIFDALGIDPWAWSLRAASSSARARGKRAAEGGTLVETRGRRGTLASVGAAVGAPVDEHDDDTPSASTTPLEHVRALLDAIRRDRMRDDVTPDDRAKLAGAEIRILKLRASLEATVESREARYVLGHPAWLRLRREIVSALEAYPIAAQAVVDAVARLEAAKVLRP